MTLYSEYGMLIFILHCPFTIALKALKGLAYVSCTDYLTSRCLLDTYLHMGNELLMNNTNMQ